MNIDTYAVEAINSLYFEGDVDFVFFSQIVGFVRFDRNDREFIKDRITIINNALSIVDWMVSAGDFFVDE